MIGNGTLPDQPFDIHAETGVRHQRMTERVEQQVPDIDFANDPQRRVAGSTTARRRMEGLARNLSSVSRNVSELRTKSVV